MKTELKEQSMITFEDALSIAKEKKPDTDNYIEYRDAYVFGTKADDFLDGGSGPCVILKKNGDAVNMAYFMTRYSVGPELKAADL